MSRAPEPVLRPRSVRARAAARRAGGAGLPSAESLESRTMMALTYGTSWVGNTGGGANNQFLQTNITGVWVDPAGKVYTNSGWDEAKREAGVYQNGRYVDQLENMHSNEGGDGGHAVAGGTYVDSGGVSRTYLFAASWDDLRRYNPNGTHAPFTGGAGPYGNDRDVVTASLQWEGRGIKGIAVDTANKRVWVTEDGDDEIEVYNLETMAFVAKLTGVDRLMKVAVGPDGSAWVARRADGGSAGQVTRYTLGGTTITQQPQTVVGAAGFDPADVGFDSGGNLLVADNGPDQQIKIYSNLTATNPAVASTFGVQGGWRAGPTPGLVGPLRFNGITGFGFDAAGKLYVAQNGIGSQAERQGNNAVLESYNYPAGTVNWKMVATDMVDTADVDPTSVNGDLLDVYTKDEHYRLNLANTAPGGEWSWVGHTVDRFAYPDDVRARLANASADYTGTPLVRTLGGKKFIFVIQQQASSMFVFRLDGEIAKPVAEFNGWWNDGPNQPANTNNWIWRDLNNDGRYQTGEYLTNGNLEKRAFGWSVDGQGNVYRGVLYGTSNATGENFRKFSFGGLDANNVPVWSFANSTNYAPIAGQANSANRIEAISDPDGTGPQTDRLYLGTFWAGSAKENGLGKIQRIDNFAGGNRAPLWTVDVPQDVRGPDDDPAAFTAVGDFVFVGYGGFNVPDPGATVRVLRASDGKFVGWLTPGPEVAGDSGALDTAYGIRAFKRSNGEYLVFVEDDERAKTIMYRWKPSAALPEAPNVAARVASNGHVRLSWDLVRDARYEVERATSSGGPFAAVGSTDNAAFTDTTAAAGTTNFYRVRAVAPAGDVVTTTGAVSTTATLSKFVQDDLNDWTKVRGGAQPAGWTLDVSTTGTGIGGDLSRAARTTDTTQHIDWNYPAITKFTAAVVWHTDTPLPDSKVLFSASPDGVSWSPVAYSRSAATNVGNNWSRATFANALALPAGTNFVRLQVVGPTGRAWSPQVASMYVEHGRATLVDRMNDLSKQHNTDAAQLGFDVTSAQVFQNDPSRLRRQSGVGTGAASYVYNLTSITAFSTRLYYQSGTPATRFKVWTSTNGADWVQRTVNFTAGAATGGGWYATDASASGFGAGVNYLKFELSGGSSYWDLQVGRTSIDYGG